MMRLLCCGCVAFAALLWMQCSRIAVVADTPGTGQETTNGLVARVISKDGGPVAGATVHLRRGDYVMQPTGLAKSAIFRADALTDAQGSFFMSGIDSGVYTIEINDRASSAVMLACTLSHADTVNFGTDTLRPYGAISGVIDSLKSPAYVQVFGLERVVRVTSSGRFTITDLPQGSFDLRIALDDSSKAPVMIRNVRILSGVATNVSVPSMSWKYMRRLALNTTPLGADVAGDVYNFPVLIRLTSSNFGFSQAQSNGGDIRFTKADNTPLSYEIERWDAAAGLAEAWVKVDTVRGNQNAQYIMMSWGASTTSTGSVASMSSGAAVFDTAYGYQGVWHLAEAGNTTAPDATPNHYDGTPQNMTAASAVPGAIGLAQEFDGVSSYIRMSNTAKSALNFPAYGTYSVSAWVNTDTLNSRYHVIASKGNLQYNLEIKTTNEWEFTEYHDTVGWDQTLGKVRSRAWDYVVGIRSGDRQYLYVNGACVDDTINTNTWDGNLTHVNRVTKDDFMLGKMVDSTLYYFNGKIDEVRVLNRALSADWIKLCYMNQRSDDRLVGK